ncbi:hypothetical protein DDZ13_04505 [Coraliomargarita sinensis]|uniref:Uncharacterized protein n=1 Tax=Coraliomargarita sinensis TaxID=2174842 RepID=A0A317ZM25_9BACT|nr:hypothetical protein [Coraliomargarita sinensis]PXA05227.1 hypothetical protein DDZ13_04505 [Coraliomargarita sinensis]
MNPRKLRHKLEKVSKLLVVVQKHTPGVNCVVDEEKGESGHLVLDFAGTGMSRSKMNALGKDLESRDYTFTEKRSPWLGQTTYTGRADDKPTVVLTVPINIDRLAIDDQAPEKAFSFSDS